MLNLKKKSLRVGADPVLVLEIPLGDRHYARYPVRDEQEAIARLEEFWQMNPQIEGPKEIIRAA